MFIERYTERLENLTSCSTEILQEILQRYVDDDDEWDEDLAASAKGSLIYSWTEKEETVEDLVEQTVKAYFRQTDSQFNR